MWGEVVWAIAGVVVGVLSTIGVWELFFEAHYRGKIAAATLELMKPELVKVTTETAHEMAVELTNEYRDKAVDAVENVKSAITEYSDKTTQLYSELQRQLLESAINLSVATNGSFKAVISEALVERGVEIDDASLDALVEKLHDQIVERVLLFQKVDKLVAPGSEARAAEGEA